MSDASQREWRFYLDDMIDFAGRVLTYTGGAMILPCSEHPTWLAGGSRLGYSSFLSNQDCVLTMRPSIALQHHREAIRQIVARHHAVNARVFGSVLYGEDTDESDLDILIDTTEETTLFDVGAIQVEICELLGVDVDVLTPGALPDRWKKKVLDEAKAV
jgi:predicted nucleotidyltransferase